MPGPFEAVSAAMCKPSCIPSDPGSSSENKRRASAICPDSACDQPRRSARCDDKTASAWGGGAALAAPAHSSPEAPVCQLRSDSIDAGSSATRGSQAGIHSGNADDCGGSGALAAVEDAGGTRHGGGEATCAPRPSLCQTLPGQLCASALGRKAAALAVYMLFSPPFM
eukprot:3855439-Rhodomonas_salina.1